VSVRRFTTAERVDISSQHLDGRLVEMRFQRGITP
jgi:hypothetical protein